MKETNAYSGKSIKKFLELYNKEQQRTHFISVPLNDLFPIYPFNKKSARVYFGGLDIITDIAYNCSTAMAFQVIDQIYDATDEVVNDIALRAGIKGNAFAEPCEERAAYLAKCLSRSDEIFQLKVVDDKIVGVRKKPLACPNITAVMDILPTHNGYGSSLGKTLTSWYFSPDIMQLEYEYKALKAENGYNVYVQVQDSENGESSLIIRAGYKIGDIFVTTQSATYRHDKPLSTMTVYLAVENMLSEISHSLNVLSNQNLCKPAVPNPLSKETLTLLGRNVKNPTFTNKETRENEICALCEMAAEKTKNWEIKRREHFLSIFSQDIVAIIKAPV